MVKITALFGACLIALAGVLFLPGPARGADTITIRLTKEECAAWAKYVYEAKNPLNKKALQIPTASKLSVRETVYFLKWLAQIANDETLSPRGHQKAFWEVCMMPPVGEFEIAVIN